MYNNSTNERLTANAYSTNRVYSLIIISNVQLIIYFPKNRTRCHHKADTNTCTGAHLIHKWFKTSNHLLIFNYAKVLSVFSFNHIQMCVCVCVLCVCIIKYHSILITIYKLKLISGMVILTKIVPTCRQYFIKLVF